MEEGQGGHGLEREGVDGRRGGGGPADEGSDMEERLEPAHTGALDPAGGVAWARACVCVCACTCVCVCVCRGDGQGRHKGPVWYNGKIWDHVDLDSSSLMTLASYCFQVSVFSSKRRVRRSTPARPWWGCSGRCPSPCPRPLHLAGEAARPTCKSEPKLLGTFSFPFPPHISNPDFLTGKK